MIFDKAIITFINKYGSSCQLQTQDLQTINFKGVIYYSNVNNDKSQSQFLHTDLYEISPATLIVADKSILRYIVPDTTINSNGNSFQILKIRKFFLADKLNYISASIIPI